MKFLQKMGMNSIERRDQSVLIIIGMLFCLTAGLNSVEMDKNVDLNCGRFGCVGEWL
jgi:hypothetical protein